MISDGAYQMNAGQSYGEPLQMEVSPPIHVDPALQAPILQPVPQGTIPVPGNEAIPDPTTSIQMPWQRQQIPAQFSRDNSSYRSANKSRMNNTTTPGLIGPLGYDVDN